MSGALRAIAMVGALVPALAFALGFALAFTLPSASAWAAPNEPQHANAERAESEESAENAEKVARADALYRRAIANEDAFAFARALAEYDEARKLDPASRHAPLADARRAMLRSHAECDFVPLAALERVRRDPQLTNDLATIDALVRQAETFPAGPVRVETWVLAAEGYARRFDRPDDAVRLYERILREPQTDRLVARKAARDLVTLRTARGDLDGARDAVRLAGDRADTKLARDVTRLVRRRALRWGFGLALAAMVLLAARAWASAAKRGDARRAAKAAAGMIKLGVAYAAYVGVGGALLASGYEAGTARPFLVLGLVLVPIFVVARTWSASGSNTPRARTLRAVICAAAALGAAFLVLERVDVAYLEGMGL